MEWLEWLSVEDACNLLRVPEDNAPIIEYLVSGIPGYIEATTGMPTGLICHDDCDETTRQLCLFLLQLWFNADGTDATKLSRVVASLTKAVKANVIAVGLDDTKEWLEG